MGQMENGGGNSHEILHWKILQKTNADRFNFSFTFSNICDYFT
jgi:hypothetical protein